MKKNLISVLLAAAGVMAYAQTAQAADGTITITGNVVGATCKVNGGTTGDLTVTLPPVSTGALAAKGQVAGRTGFAIKLSNCNPTTGKVHAYFEPGPTVDPSSGGLIVDAGGAANVQIGLLNSDSSRIVAGAADASQNSQTANIASGTANLNYFAQYEATGVAGAGAANSRVQYTLVYQ